MADVSVNSVQPSEASKELVALYLLGSVAMAEGATVIYRDGIPYVNAGMTKKQILQNYLECLWAAKNANNMKAYISNLPD